MTTFIPRHYQEEAIRIMMENPYHYLAFDIGLGKTATVLEYLRRTGKKALIIAPLLVAERTWPQEIKKWEFGFDYTFVHGKHKRAALESNTKILITNYATIKWLYEYGLAHGGSFFRERVIVFDESTAFKRASSQRFKMLQAMQHLFKQGVLNLSGEPLPEGYLGLWSQYWILDRGRALGATISQYKAKYFYDSGPPRWICRLKNPWLTEEIKGLVAHETSVLLAKDYGTVPEAMYQDVNIHLDSDTLRKYHRLANESVFDSDGMEILASTSGVLTNKLRQVVSGGIYAEDGSTHIIHTHKADMLKEVVEQAQGSPILCPINFLFEVELIRRVLGYEVPCIHGKTSNEEKTRLLNLWDHGVLPLLLCHPASLSHGLNMQTGGHIIVWFSLPWSLEWYKQLNGRLIRHGQTKPVRVMHFVAKGTVDEEVASILSKKDATQDDFKFDLRLAPKDLPI